MSRRFGFVRRGWFLVFIVGLSLFLIAEEVLRLTNNPNLIPTVLLLGAFLVPLSFVTFIFEYEPVKEVPLPTVIVCFLWGGIIGVAAAGLIEYATLQTLNFASLLGIAAIEEAVKLIFPLVLFFRGRYRSEADGLLFGVSSGMAFAALETMGYGLVALLGPQGSIGALQNMLFVRGILSPAGHAAWTGMMGAVIWQQRARGRSIASGAVFGTFLLVVILHTLWDFFDLLPSKPVALAAVSVAGNVAVAAISLGLLARRIRESVRATT
jgi:RsiW-degrading membrane proteinase PrsW (M82 family)